VIAHAAGAAAAVVAAAALAFPGIVPSVDGPWHGQNTLFASQTHAESNMATGSSPNQADLIDADLAYMAQNPWRILAAAGLIAIVSIIVTLFLYGLVHYLCGTFYETELRDTLREKHHDIWDKLQQFDVRKRERDAEVQRLDALIATESLNGPTEKMGVLMRRRDQLKAEPTAPPVVAPGYYLSDLSFVWPILYTCLGWLIFLVPPLPSRKPSMKDVRAVLLTTLCLYVMFHWGTWTRNFILSSEKRRVYVGENYDISHVVFFSQEVIGFGFCVLLATAWKKWIDAFLARREFLTSSSGKPMDVILDYEFTDRLATTFALWQAASLILALAFVGFSFFHWNNLFLIRDYRYAPHAFITHFIWGVSWLLLSLPLIVTWQNWTKVRARAIACIATTQQEKPPADVQLKAIQELQPIGIWNAIGTAIVAVVGFLLPLLGKLSV
jgi:hypothetical protein